MDSNNHIDMEALRLIEERRRERATTVATGDNSPAAGNVDADDTIAHLAKLRERSAEFEKQFGERVDRMPVITCPEHPETVLTLDRQTSLLRSWETRQPDGSWKMVPVLSRCMACGAAVEVAKMAVLLEAMGVPELLWPCRITNWIPETDDDRVSLGRITEYAKKPRGFLLIVSPNPGLGKSHLAVGVLAYVGQGRFITHAEFISKLRAEYSKGPRRIERQIAETPLLVFDEIGLSTGGGDELTALHTLLNARYSKKLPTIITGNFPNARDIESVVGDRMYDRMKEATFAAITLGGKSKRQARRGVYLED